MRGIGTNIGSVKGEKVRLKMMEIHIDDIFNNLKKIIIRMPVSQFIISQSLLAIRAL